MSLRDQLSALIKSWNLKLCRELKNDTSLVKSGLLDSLALLNLALWIEQQIGSRIDPTVFNLSEEWDTMADILNFIEKHRANRTTERRTGTHL